MPHSPVRTTVPEAALCPRAAHLETLATARTAAVPAASVLHPTLGEPPPPS
jgi:hypothetical protein